MDWSRSWLMEVKKLMDINHTFKNCSIWIKLSAVQNFNTNYCLKFLSIMNSLYNKYLPCGKNTNKIIDLKCDRVTKIWNTKNVHVNFGLNILILLKNVNLNE